ncbi:RNA polymerase sigma factor [Thermoleophilia bacterium SCSIO 60948]|nr:RNA polymerase sigma factor [Thermoleophilia bacterium SCSIO 60948]
MNSTTDATSDAELLRRSRETPEVFGEIFERHHPAVFGYLAFRVRRETAEDLATATFLTAFEKRNTFRSGHQSARPWLLGIATNKLLRHSRSAARERRALGRLSPDPGPPSIEDGVVERAEAQRRIPDLGRVLRSLSKNDAAVVLLYIYADLSQAEIGEALAIPAGTVKSRLSRARRQLERELLASQQDNPTPEVI